MNQRLSNEHAMLPTLMWKLDAAHIYIEYTCINGEDGKDTNTSKFKERKTFHLYISALDSWHLEETIPLCRLSDSHRQARFRLREPGSLRVPHASYASKTLQAFPHLKALSRPPLRQRQSRRPERQTTRQSRLDQGFDLRFLRY